MVAHGRRDVVASCCEVPQQLIKRWPRKIDIGRPPIYGTSRCKTPATNNDRPVAPPPPAYPRSSLSASMLLSKLNLLILVSLCHTSLAAAANEVMFSGTFNSWSNDAATNPGIYSELAEDCIIDGGSYNEYFYSDPILIPAGEAYSFKAFVVSGYSNTGLISDCSGQCGLNTCAMTAGWYPDTGSNQALPVDLFRAQRYVLHFFPFGKKEDDILPAGNTCAANHCPLVAFEAVATTASPTVSPTVSPTLTSTQAPTHAPTLATTHASTTAPTHAPSLAPTPPPLAPTLAPTDSPTAAPTSQHPTSAPSASPSPAPTGTPYRPPPFDQDIEVDIEGLAEDDFPDELKGLFRLQVRIRRHQTLRHVTSQPPPPPLPLF